MDYKSFERPKDLILDCVNGNQKEFNICLLRLTSFSSVAANVASAGRDDANLFSKKILKESIESVTKQELSCPLEKNKYDSSDAGVICGEAFNKVTPRFDLVIIDEAQNIRNDNNATAFLNAWLGYKRPKRKSVLKATKTLLMSATPAHRNVETLKNQLKYFVDEGDIPEKLSHEYLEEFMIRRLRTYKGENKYECRLNKAEDVGSDLTIEQRLFLALTQKKIADYKISNNATYKIGFLETFESYDPIDEPECKEQDKDKEFENGNSHKKGEYGQAVDKKLMKDIAESYKKTFGEKNYPPHPKLNYMEKTMVKTPKSGEINEENYPDKAIIFVRRIASVKELQKRLENKYERQIIEYWSRRFDIKIKSLKGIQEKFEQEYNKSVRTRDIDDDVTDDEEPDVSEENKKNEYDKSELIKWLKTSDKTKTFSAVSRFKKSLQRNCSNYDFFEENYLRTVFNYFKINDQTTKNFTQYINSIVNDGFVDEVKRYVSANPDDYFHKSSGKKGNTYFKSNLMVLCCYIAINRINPALASFIQAFYKISEETAEPSPDLNINVKLLKGILKGSSIWNLILEDNSHLFSDLSSYDSFCKRELMKKCIQKYLLLSESILEILFIYCTRDRKRRTNDAIVRFVNNIWEKKTYISVRIRQFIDNYELIYSQLFSDIKEKMNSSYNIRTLNDDTRFLNDQKWVVGATGETENKAIISRFNTPFYPDIVVCTDVMKEGINLHLFCNKVFHYGLAWTPGDLEQRVGRVDRYFSKTFRARSLDKDMKVEITYPYMGKTIDEQQLKKVLGFKIAVDPLLDYTTTKNIDIDSLESTSVGELASFVPDERIITNTPYSGQRFWWCGITIRLLLEFKTYCVWLYDQNNELMSNDNPPEWKDDKELKAAFTAVSELYDTFYNNDNRRIKFVGCPNEETRQKLIGLIDYAVEVLTRKNNGKYIIKNDISLDF